MRVLSEPTRLCFVPLPSTRTLLPPSEPGVCNIPSNRLLRRGLSVVSPIFFDLQLLRRGINFVILSLRYHVVPHGIYRLRRMISAKMTDITHNNTPHIIERPSRPCSLPSFQFRFWTSSPVHIPSVLYENEACASPPNISCFAEAHQRKATPIAIDRVDCCLYSCICSLHLGPLCIRILSFLQNIEKSWGGGAAFSARRKNEGPREVSKPIDPFARGASASIFCRRLVLIPTWKLRRRLSLHAYLDFRTRLPEQIRRNNP